MSDEAASHATGITLPELKAHQCKWPVGESREVVGGFYFCGRQRMGDGPYCERHAKIAFAGLRAPQKPAA